MATTAGNERIAAAFEEVSELLELTGDNPHRVRSYASVARTLGALPRPAAEMAADGSLLDVKGVGEGTLARVREFHATGTLSVLEELRAKVPAGLHEIRRVPGLGPKRVRAIWRSLGVTTLAELEYACLENRLRDLDGFGDRLQEAVVKGIGFLKRSKGLRLLSQARGAAERILNRLQRSEHALRLAVTGPARRMTKTLPGLDLLATAHDAKGLLDAFAAMPFVERVADRASDRASVVLEDGTPVTLTVVEEAAFFAALVLSSSDDAHRAALVSAAESGGYRLSPRGLFRARARVDVDGEDDVYRLLGLAPIPPELREGPSFEPPPDDLLVARDVRGVLHAHTTASDGRYSLREMVERAAESGFSWFAVCDHSRTAAYARGLDAARVREQRREVDAWNASGESPIPVLHGIESDILPDGSLDYPDDVLDGFDVVIGSVHSSMTQPPAAMTERLVRAVSNPRIHVLGHPTGRLLLGREGYAFDLDRVLDACARNGTAVELNANPHRLDFDEDALRAAAGRGIRVAIDPDAHDLLGIDDVVYGVGVARRARLRRPDVLTALDVEEFRAWCAAKRGKRRPPPLAFRRRESPAAPAERET